MQQILEVMNAPSVEYRPFTVNIPLAEVKRFKTIARVMEWGFEPIPQPKQTKKHLSAREEAMEDIRCGRVYHAESADDMFKQILG